MLGSHELSPVVLVAGMLLGGFCVLRSLGSWVTGLQLLTVAVLFGGMAGARAGSGALPIAFRDVMIVVPVYLAFLCGRARREALKNLPGELAAGFVLVAAWMVVCLFNLGNVSTLQLLIGLKVWVFYIPFLFVGIGLAARPQAMFKFFRTFLLLGLVAVGVGLVQSFLIRIIGYAPTMTLFFGDAAPAVSQGFTFFLAGGGIFRVPGTFSFGSQYVAFLYLYLTVAMIETNADPHPWYRSVARMALFVTLIASVVSGTKGALVTFPLFVIGYAFFGLLRSRFLIYSPIAIAVGAVALEAIGIDVLGLFKFGATQAQTYAEGFFLDEIEKALNYGAFGRGIGSNTNGARYAIAGTDFGRLVGLESYFAKITVELGAIGLVVFSFFLVGIGIKTALVAFRNRLSESREIIAPLAIYLLYNLVTLFKAWSLDVDPVNIFFWLALGVMIGVDRSARRARRAARQGLQPLSPAELPAE